MAFLLILLIAAAVVTANIGLQKGKTEKPKQTKVKEAKVPRQRQTPVAKKYTMLYRYVLLNVLFSLVSAAWSFIFSHAWTRLTSQLQTKGGPYLLSAQTMRIIGGVGLVCVIVVYAIVYSYLLLSKSVSGVITLLKVLFALGLVGLLIAVTTKPSVELLLGVLTTGYTFLVQRSLAKGENELFWR